MAAVRAPRARSGIPKSRRRTRRRSRGGSEVAARSLSRGLRAATFVVGPPWVPKSRRGTRRGPAGGRRASGESRAGRVGQERSRSPASGAWSPKRRGSGRRRPSPHPGSRRRKTRARSRSGFRWKRGRGRRGRTAPIAAGRPPRSSALTTRTSSSPRRFPSFRTPGPNRHPSVGAPAARLPVRRRPSEAPATRPGSGSQPPAWRRRRAEHPAHRPPRQPPGGAGLPTRWPTPISLAPRPQRHPRAPGATDPTAVVPPTGRIDPQHL